MIKILRCYAIIYWSKLVRLLGKRYKKSNIPKGVYCYDYNPKTKAFKCCPYWVPGSSSRMIAGCKYLECVDKGLCLWDQVKECNINNN